MLVDDVLDVDDEFFTKSNFDLQLDFDFDETCLWFRFTFAYHYDGVVTWVDVDLIHQWDDRERKIGDGEGWNNGDRDLGYLFTGEVIILEKWLGKGEGIMKFGWFDVLVDWDENINSME